MQLGHGLTEGPQEMMQNTTLSDLLHSGEEAELFCVCVCVCFTNCFPSMIKAALRDINFLKFLLCNVHRPRFYFCAFYSLCHIQMSIHTHRLIKNKVII